jgi:hypothetical protein
VTVGRIGLVGREPGGEQPGQPGLAEIAAESVAGQRRELPGAVGRSEDPLFHLRRRPGRPGYREPGRGLMEPADLRLAGGAVLQMTLEFGSFLGA